MKENSRKIIESLSADHFLLFAQSAGWTQYKVKEDIKYCIKRSIYVVTLLINDKPAGMIRCVGDGVFYYTICDLVILPEFQNEGNAMYLIDYMLTKIKNEAIAKSYMIYLFCFKNLNNLYIKKGFHEITLSSNYQCLYKLS